MADTTSPDAASEDAGAERKDALHRVEQRRALQTHAFVYVVVNLSLWIVWVIIGATAHRWYPWPAWAAVGWGLGLALHTWGIHFRRPISEHGIRTEIGRKRL